MLIMTSVILATINATYTQTSLGLRYLLANMGDISTSMMEFTAATGAQDIAEKILLRKPRIVALSLYVWNYRTTMDLARLLKSLSSDLILIGGGPELMEDNSELLNVFDYLIRGEAEVEFPQLCQSVLKGENPLQKLIDCPEVDLKKINLPYRLYSDHDLQTRRIMVESSRGCPFQCQFCLSSLDQRVRHFDLDLFLKEMKHLWDRGARDFKFIDRTFNLKIEAVERILNFFLNYANQGLFLHFEIVPDQINERLFALLEQFPSGVIQFEVGIQSFNDEVSERIGRNQNYKKVKTNISRLLDSGKVHLHTDLIVGLPGEDLESFARGFDELMELKPHEIQVGILKRLKGAPIEQHTQAFNMRYRDVEPYEVISTSVLSFLEVQKMRRFARFFNLFYNSGNFKKSIVALLNEPSGAFKSFYQFSNWIFEQTEQTYQISLERLTRLFCQYRPDLEELIIADYMSVAGRTLPSFVRKKRESDLHRRQRRHQ